MSEQDKIEIRRIIQEEIQARIGREENLSPQQGRPDETQVKVIPPVNVETVSPTY